MTGKTVLIQAAPFCYGPISTMLNVVEPLARRGHRLIVIDEGPTGELLRRSGLAVESLKARTAPPFSPELCSAIDAADLVVSNTDPVFAAACMGRGSRVAVVDTLFWMWDHFDHILLDCPLFVVQDFFGTDEQLARLGTPRNLVRVGPLIKPQTWQPRPPREGSIHVSMGGCDCLLVDPKCDPYPGVVCGLVEEALAPDLGGVFTSGERAVASVGSRLARVKARTLSNRDYLELLGQARALVLTPGLTGAMEAFEMGKPVFFLPPQNYSQVIQLDAYRKAGAAPFGCTWSDVYADFQLPPYLPEEEAVRRVRRIVDRFADDRAAQTVLGGRISDFLRRGIDSYDPMPARRVRESFGMDGPARAAEAIDDLLAGTRSAS